VEKKENYTHEELVSLCEQSVVSCENWNNRDSLIAQKQLSDIYGYLTGNVKYIFKVDHKYETINIQFFPTNEDKKKVFFMFTNR